MKTIQLKNHQSDVNAYRIWWEVNIWKKEHIKMKKEEVNVPFSIKLMILLSHLPKLREYPMQLIVVKNQKQKGSQKKKIDCLIWMMNHQALTKWF